MDGLITRLISNRLIWSVFFINCFHLRGDKIIRARPKGLFTDSNIQLYLASFI